MHVQDICMCSERPGERSVLEELLLLLPAKRGISVFTLVIGSLITHTYSLWIQYCQKLHMEEMRFDISSFQPPGLYLLYMPESNLSGLCSLFDSVRSNRLETRPLDLWTRLTASNWEAFHFFGCANC
ncbi:hypothetical protein CEXT_815591 [Caerostris extrusa]|uniref:Uncharacterized protein n=1 Tax=Caerostris extrusa TaxID=172846 RepID=A0AAV4S238_CAEEX|nr:hypothetical protein CEXT_815591 [Caerostris extrusa]